MGDFLTAGYRSNYRPEVVMNHIYFTAIVDGPGLAAEIAAELTGSGAVPRVYLVEPTGTFENDPNVTDKKFPGNPTRSYRSSAPLKVTGEITHWTGLTPEALQVWRERLTALRSDERGDTHLARAGCSAFRRNCYYTRPGFSGAKTGPLKKTRRVAPAGLYLLAVLKLSA
ncbi:NAD(+)--rifampin ADP-ribosyltransferase [Tardiphaga sp. P5_C10]